MEARDRLLIILVVIGLLAAWSMIAVAAYSLF